MCSVADARAIFVDVETITAAAMHRVKSRVGEATSPRRTAHEYTRSPTSATTPRSSSR